MIQLNLEDIYPSRFVSKKLDHFTFISPLNDGSRILLNVKITPHPDPLLLDVFNLAFGPMGDDGEIDDQIVLNHVNISKVLSTVVLAGITFLEGKLSEKYYIGIDGSNETRAYLYHRMFLRNYQQLKDSVLFIGVDWYVKLLRDGSDFERDDDGYPFLKPIIEPFDLNRKANNLYRYYLFTLKT